MKTSRKYCTCHTKRLSTRSRTRLNITKCHACHAKRSNDTSETSKNDHLCRTSHRHGHMVLARTVALANATSSEHTLNPQTPRVKRKPLLRIREKHRHLLAPWSRSPRYFARGALQTGSVRCSQQPATGWRHCNLQGGRMTSEICKMGPPVDSVNRWFLCGLTMVYGRYNELVFMEIIMVYKPTFTSLGGGHPVWMISIFHNNMGMICG